MRIVHGMIWAAAGLLSLAAAPAGAGGWDHPQVFIGGGQHSCPGQYRDRLNHDTGDRRATWRCDIGTRPHRDALEDGFFGHGRTARGGFEYDRGYPYDYYPRAEREEGRHEHYAESGEAGAPARSWCETRLVRDARGRQTAPVTICRN